MEKFLMQFQNLIKLLINLNISKLIKEFRVKNQIVILKLNKLDILVRILDVVQKEMKIENHLYRYHPHMMILLLSHQLDLMLLKLLLKLMKYLMNQKVPIKILLKCPYFHKMLFLILKLLKFLLEEILHQLKFQNHLLFNNNLSLKLLAINILNLVNLSICKDLVVTEEHIEKKGKLKY